MSVEDRAQLQELLDNHPWPKLPRWQKWMIAWFLNPWSSMKLLEDYHRLMRWHWRCLMDHGYTDDSRSET